MSNMQLFKKCLCVGGEGGGKGGVISQIILNFNFLIFQYQQHIPTHMHIAQYGQVKHNSLTN